MANTWFQHKPKLHMGININKKQMTIAIAEHQSGQWYLKDGKQFVIVEGKELQTLQNAIKEVSQNGSVDYQQIIAGIPYSEVIMKNLTVDANLSEYEIYRFIQESAHTLFGLSHHVLFFDFEKIKPIGIFANQTVDPHQISLRVIATRRTKILTMKQLFRQAGIKLNAINVEILGLAHMVSFLSGYIHTKPYALLLLQPETLSLCVFQKNLLCEVKEIIYQELPITSSNLLDAIQKALQFFRNTYPQLYITELWLAGSISLFSSPEVLADFSRQLQVSLAIALLQEKNWRPHSTQLAVKKIPEFICAFGLAINERQSL